MSDPTTADDYIIPIRSIEAHLIAIDYPPADVRELYDSTCVICKGKLSDQCGLCSSPAECRLAKGVCGDVFHKHCIDRYIEVANANSICPCTKTWSQVRVMDRPV